MVSELQGMRVREPERLAEVRGVAAKDKSGKEKTS